MENYAKVVLYAYPLLKTVEKDYAEHIRNRAILSYESNTTAQRLAEYLAGELICQKNLSWLKSTVKEVVDKLSAEERELLSIRYFGKTFRARNFLKPIAEGGEKGWSARKYFRKQARLSDKVGAMLRAAGITNELYQREFMNMDIFRKIHQFVEEGRDRKISADERRLLQG